MKTRLLLLLCVVSLVLCSCDDYGKKVQVNAKSEVYYKGDGVTEADAKKLGDFLLKFGVFDDKDERSVQLLGDKKNPDVYTVKLVMDKENFSKNKELFGMTYWSWQDVISQNAFGGKKVRIILTDDKFNDLETMDDITRINTGQDHYVLIKGNSVKEQEGKNIADSLELAKFFNFTNGMAILTKERGELTIRFMPNKEKSEESSYTEVLENFRYVISKYALDGGDVSLVLIDKNYNDVKSIKEPTDERKARIDRLMQGQPDSYDQTQTQYTNNPYEPQTEQAPDDTIHGGGY